jgi:hypothetical protein
MTPRLFMDTALYNCGSADHVNDPHPLTTVRLPERTMADVNSTKPPVHSRSKNGTPLFEKFCPDCGKRSVVDRRKLGKRCHQCAHKARSTHGLSAGGKLDPLYRLYINMRARCERPSCEHYRYYGGRGIKVCDEWRGNRILFFEWARAAGWRQGLDIDRIDNDGDYTPDNCRFTTHRINSQRTSRIRTTLDQARRAREMLRDGISVKAVAVAVGVTYMVAWHIKNNPDVWSNA